MTEEEELLAFADKLIEDFKGLESVKKYHLLKEAVEKDEHLSKLKEDRENLQKNLRYLEGEKKTEAINACRKMQEEYDSNPLVINFNAAKEEILSLIEPLTETKL